MKRGSDPDRPLDDADSERLFASLRAEGLVLVAVSGGPDSISLLHLLAEWAGRTASGPRLAAATVDHGLRSGSREEAEAVARAASRLGIDHAILPWRDHPAGRRVSQDKARAARYRLLAEQAWAIDATALATAHTLDDQAETLLIRLAAGSGPRGLAGMRPIASLAGLRLHRPLLGIPKAALVATCRERGWVFAEDPSNRDPRHARARWRALMPALGAEGLDARRLARLATRLARVEEALEAETVRAAARCGLVARQDGAEADGRRLLAEPEEIALRLLARALGGEGLRLERLETCLAALREACGQSRALRRTIAGRLVALDRAGRLVVSPEGERHRGMFTSFAVAAPQSLGRGQGRA